MKTYHKWLETMKKTCESVVRHDFVEKRAPCPFCGVVEARQQKRTRRIPTANSKRQTVLRVDYSFHECGLHGFFHTDTSSVVRKGARYSRRVERLAVLMRKRGMTFQAIRNRLYGKWHVKVPLSSLSDMVYKAKERVS